jgi:hypothetical protein
MSRRVYLVGLGLALVALALAFTDWALSLQAGVTEANFKRIRVGMTEAEVEGLMGGRGEDRTGCRRAYDPTTRWRWKGPAGYAYVNLDGTGRVEEAEWYPTREPQPGPLARLRTWLGW